jgi:putative ABC transport system ATP-binding protein
MIIQTEKLTKRYFHKNGEVYALKDISLSLQKGSFVTITGPSGAGKTTLLLALGGLIRPTSGKILFNGTALHDASDNALASFRLNNIGFVMQSFALIPYLTALENIMTPLSLQGKPKEEQQKKAMKLLGDVGLSDRTDHLPRELSSGQQQRVAIARALVNNPSMILADEPTGNLDPALSDEILSLLKKLNEENGITIILVTHSKQAEEFGTEKIRIIDGMIDQPLASSL